MSLFTLWSVATLCVSLATSIQSPHQSIIRRDPSDVSLSAGGLVEEGTNTYRSLFGDLYTIAPDGSLKKVFDHVADSNAWGSSESLSGKGSTVDMTSKVRTCLGDWIKKYNVKTFVDVPCGDANWQGHIPGIDSITYKGFDIADKPVKTARVKNAQHSAMSFDTLDLTSQVPPVKADIFLMRDVIQHLSLEQGLAMMTHAKASGARYLAVSTWYPTNSGHNLNVEINPDAGLSSYPKFYNDDVHASPFSLPKPLETCDNDATPVWGSDKLELIDLSTWSPTQQSDKHVA